MLIDLNRYMAAICPECSEAIITPVSAFSFSGGHSVTIKCISKNCNTECVSITPKSKKFQITLVCPFCGDHHSFTVTRDKLWSQDIITFPCPETGISIFFFGKSENVRKSLEESLSSIEQIFKSTLDEIYGINELPDDYFEYDEDDILYDILDELHELRDSGSLSCICGSETISINPIDNTILLSCPRCRRSKRLEVSEQTLAMIINASAIVIGR